MNKTILFAYLFFFFLMSSCGEFGAGKLVRMKYLENERPNIKTLQISIPDQGTYQADYEIIDGLAYAHGDVVLGPVDENGELVLENSDQVEVQGVAINKKVCLLFFCKEFRWPGGIVPYVISDELNSTDLKNVLAAMEEYHAKTSIRFVPKNDSHKDYVEFVYHGDQGSCGAWPGRWGGKQFVYLYPNVCGKVALIHELGHVLGLQHEHTRCDRSDYVDIHWENISFWRRFNFIKLCLFHSDIREYDHHSIMHYGNYYFSNNSKKTITLKSDPNFVFGARELSDGDIQAIEQMYSDPQ